MAASRWFRRKANEEVLLQRKRECMTSAKSRKSNWNVNASDFQVNDDNDNDLVSKSNFAKVRHLIQLHSVY